MSSAIDLIHFSTGFLPEAGDSIGYRLGVKNTGQYVIDTPVISSNLGLVYSGISRLDPILGININIGDANRNGSFDANETWYYRAFYTVTAADIDGSSGSDNVVNGALINRVNVSTRGLGGAADQTASKASNISLALVEERPAFTLTQTSTPNPAWVGDRINYAIAVQNTGNLTLYNLSLSGSPFGTPLAVTDPQGANVGDVDGDGNFDVGETWRYLNSYTVTQADIDNLGAIDGSADGALTYTVTATAGLSGEGSTVDLTVISSTESNLREPVSASLGDRLWSDSNGNGIQDAGEAGIVGQIVTLIGGGADGVINGVADTTTTTTTDANGIYTFTGLTPGQHYQVQFSKPAGTVFTVPDVGAGAPGSPADASDSDANPADGKTQIVTLAQGENNQTLDAGVVSLPPSGGIRLVKATNAANPSNPTAAEDANLPPGLALQTGTNVVWTYQVFNESTRALQITSLVDDAGTPQTTADDFSPVMVVSAGFNLGDIDKDNLLDTNEVWLYTSSGVPGASYRAQPGLPQLGGPSLTFNFSQANSYALLGLNGGNVTVNSATAVKGDFGYSQAVTSTTNQKIGEDFFGQWNGTAYVHSQVANFQSTDKNYIPSAGKVSNAAQDSRLNTANAEALAASAQLAALTPTIHLGAINDTSVSVGAVNGAANLNVVQISSLNMNSDVLELRGDEQDYFVINTLGNFDFSQSEVRLSGGLTANHVIFNFPTAGTQTRDVLINKSSTIFNGTILAPDLDGFGVQYHNPAQFNGAIIAKNISVHSDFNLNWAPFYTSYTNIGTVSAVRPGTTTTFTDTDPSSHYGVPPSFQLNKTVSVIPGCPTGPIGAVDTDNNGVVDGGINLGNLTKYLFVFANGSIDANWQGATKGFVGNVAIDGISADERTSGGVPFAGTIFTNDTTLGAWQGIVNQNAGQATAATGQTALIAGLETDLSNAFTQINGLSATAGYTSVSATALNGLNTQDGINRTYVINVTSGLQVSSKINITGDAGDVFVMRWDTDANAANGYQGQVKFQSGGAIVPLGGLTAGNFIHVAGDINASGGGNTPAAPYPQGPRLNGGQGNLPTGAQDFNGGGFFTGYWLTTGDPVTGQTSPLSNGLLVGGWYTTTNKFSMTSGTSGTRVCVNDATQAQVFNPANVGTDVSSAQVGDRLLYTFAVKNTGSGVLAAPSLIDNNGTPTNPTDDFVPTPVLTNGRNHGDTNANGQFDAGETWYYQGSVVATAPGVLTNLATASVGSASVTDTATVSIVRRVAASKFFVVDSSTDRFYGYNTFGAATGDQALAAANTESRGITGDAQGTTLWVLDRNKSVYVTTTSGVAQGSWTATDLSTSPEGIAKDGNHLWMVDSANKRIYWYQNAAANTSGTDTAEKTFALAAAVVPKGLTTDGTSLWVVSDSTANTVFRYTIVKDGTGTPTSLTPSGSWTLAAANTTPTGITLDPTGVSKSLWVVDLGTDTVYEYANGTLLSSGTNVAAVASFKLSSGNTTPQDIFDPVFTQASAPAESSVINAAEPDALTGLVGTGTAPIQLINPGQPSPAWVSATDASSSSNLLGNPGLESVTANLDDLLLSQLNHHPLSGANLMGAHALMGTALL